MNTARLSCRERKEKKIEQLKTRTEKGRFKTKDAMIAAVILVLGRQRQGDHCKFKTSMITCRVPGQLVLHGTPCQSTDR